MAKMKSRTKPIGKKSVARNLPPAHTGRPVRGCECKWCVRHRKLAAEMVRNRDQCTALGVLGQAVIAGLERQDRRDWEINRRDANEPMISDPVWYVHHKR